MINYFWTMPQRGKIARFCLKHNIPELIKEEIFRLIHILDSNYGIGRDMEADGGFVAVLISDEGTNIDKMYDGILDRYNVKRECCEFEDILYSDGTGHYQADLYIANSEFSFVIIRFVGEKG